MMTRRLLTPFLLALFLLGSLNAKDFPAGSPTFESDYDSALAKATKEGKPLLLVFSATWCRPCQVNKAKVYPDSTVKPFHDKFIWAYLDVDQKQNEALVKRFGIGEPGKGIPFIQFLDKSGKAIDSLLGETKPKAFAEKLTTVLKRL